MEITFSVNLRHYRFFKGKTDNVLAQIFRYFFAGGVAFVIDYSLLFVCKEFLGFHYLLAAAAGFSVGLVTTYLFSIFWIFDNRKLKNRTTEFLIFALIGIIGLLLTILFMWIFTDMAHIHYLISKIITTVIVFLWNFIAKKYFLF